ncbi:MAG: cysteine synthase family protein [Desulfopila sp.]|jgi:cystathionine beta-synthase|nr:cysteine synthase family protein [Desulfopila sp.]
MENQKPYATVLDMIGNTPVVELSRFSTGSCRLFLKLECTNPGGSIKDRIALGMIRDAEEKGYIKPGDTLIEATAGNTGLGLALVAGQKGYRVKIVMPDKMSIEKKYCLEAMGAEVIMTRSDVTKGHPAYYQDLAESLAQQESGFYINQFSNKANRRTHYRTTGPEIWRQLDGMVDAVVFGVGTGGTMSGAGGFLREKNPDIDIVLADPEGSVLAPLVRSGTIPAEVGSWYVEGIGEDFVPEICNLDLVSRAYSIPDREAFATARKLLFREGVSAGSSTGTLLAAALRYCREQSEPKRVLTFACDTGNRYLSKLYNDEWMEQHLPPEKP